MLGSEEMEGKLSSSLTAMLEFNLLTFYYDLKSIKSVDLPSLSNIYPQTNAKEVDLNYAFHFVIV